ncbi:sensor histidine kinase [Rathayibacter tanaceti]|uniref:histidine kinase n=2 Tax=Rathayibacter tanaceti TaxID=1671680 RepID=A0A162J1V4_9MICO|nr:sensor histidine kinase [Rathayibacter tanaceti]KZX20977.1 Sensor histidine kinase DesK [Rathayibacter tanaceti]QHC54314.1 sensor histidine kinase [Rathayibacter tanaceti]TCO37994.1 signal transduction histidine kinase [Rathayibacter tanaceti]
MSSGAGADPFAPGWTRRAPRRLGYVQDTIGAGMLLVATLASVALYTSAGFPDAAHPIVSAHWAVLMTLPLALRRRFPATVALGISAVYTLGLVLQVPESLFNQICLFLALYTVGAWGRDRRAALVVRVVIAIALLGWLMVSLVTGDWLGRAVPSHDSAGLLSPYVAESALAVVSNLLYFGSAYVFGEASWQSARQLEALEARTAELDDERERSSRQAVSSERLRIARELHDVVAHHVSVMGVQAGAARRVLARDPEKAAASLSAIERDARSAIEELHRILIALRAEDAAPNPLTDSASTRGVAQLEELVAASDGSGLPTAFRTLGTPRAIPATVGLSLYRIAQESLTNVRKHAGPGAHAEVRLRYSPDAVELEIADDGGSGPHPGTPASCGLGHTGMTERAAAVGGTIEMGPRGGGYLVHARVPLSPSRAGVEEPGVNPVASTETPWGRHERASGGRT